MLGPKPPSFFPPKMCISRAHFVVAAKQNLKSISRVEKNPWGEPTSFKGPSENPEEEFGTRKTPLSGYGPRNLKYSWNSKM